MGVQRETTERDLGDPATPAMELESALSREELVVVCWEPGCTMHHLPHWPDHQWVSREQVAGYSHYSHGVCPWHHLTYRLEVARYGMRRQARRETGRGMVTAG